MEPLLPKESESCRSLNEIIKQSVTSLPPKKWYHSIADFFRRHVFIRIGMAQVQQGLSTKRIVVLTKNEVKESEKESYLSSTDKVLAAADPRFARPVPGGEIKEELKKSHFLLGKCWGGSALLAKNWLQRGKEGMTKISKQFSGGVPQEAAKMHDRYNYRFDAVAWNPCDLDETQKELVDFYVNYFSDRQKYNPIWVNATALESIKENDPDKKFKKLMLQAIDRSSGVPNNELDVLFYSFFKEKGYVLTDSNLKIVESIIVLLGGSEDRGLKRSNFSLEQEGLKPIESVIIDFRTAVSSFSNLDDGVYTITTPTFTYSLWGCRITGSHALDVIVDKGTTYFYDPNVAIWEADKENASRLGEGILWKYMIPEAVHLKSMTITRVEIMDQDSSLDV